MSCTREYCRCCYSTERLEMLCGPELGVYKLIRNLQAFKNDNTPVSACVRCREFLKEVYYFRIDSSVQDLDVKPHHIDTVLISVIDDYSSQIGIKKELNEEYNEIGKIEIEINKVEVDFEPENVRQISDLGLQNLLVVNEHFDSARHRKSHLYRDCPFKCSECSYETTTMQSLKSHITCKHSDEKPFCCDHCNYRGKLKFNIVRHMMKHFNDPSKNIECSQCSYKTTSMSSLKRHALHKHSNEKPFCCDLCDYSGKTKGNLTLHKMNHMNDDDKPFKCNLCSYKTTTPSNLKYHIVYKHSNARPFCCDHCDYRGKFKFSIVRHMIKHFGDSNKTFHCTECSYKTIHLSGLKRHAMHKHSDEKPFRCDLCDYCGKTKAVLTTHKLNHLNGDDKPYKCSKCSYKTVYLSHLKRHTLCKHTDEKLSKKKLSLHKTTHLNRNDRPFKCNECPYQSFNQWCLKKHVLYKHSDERPFSCDQCNYSAKIKGDLIAHKKRHLKDG